MGSVCVLGTCVEDTTFRVNRMPAEGESLTATSCSTTLGGKGFNQAIAAIRLGSDVSMIGVMGNDQIFDRALDRLRREGIGEHITPGRPNSGRAAVIVEDKTGENRIVGYPGPAMWMLGRDINDEQVEMIRNTDVFVTQMEQSMDATETALGIAREEGVTTILDPAPIAGTLPESILKLCDYVTPNLTEMGYLAGGRYTTNVTDMTHHLMDLGVGRVVLTMGRFGVFLREPDTHTAHHVEAHNADRVVETTGAGDAFVGGLATGLAEGMQPLDAVRFGNVAAGVSVTREGTSDAMPMRTEVEGP